MELVLDQGWRINAPTPIERIVDSDFDDDQAIAGIRVLGVPTDVHERADYFSGKVLTGAAIRQYVNSVHEIVVPGIPTVETTFPVTLGGYVWCMSVGKRGPLLEHAAKLAGELSMMRRKPDDDQFYLERLAIVTGLATVLTHAYDDGNGRAGRVSAGLMYSGPEPPDHLLVLGRHRGGRTGRFIPLSENDPNDTLNAAAGTDIALADPNSYHSATSSYFCTPHLTEDCEN